MATPAPHLVDDILEEIFLRLPTPAALARASTACPRFRRIITERPFLRRYRKLHPPPLLGLVRDSEGFFPAQAPHPSAPLAHALADAADFTYSFLPECSEEIWSAVDARDGRILVEDTDISSCVDRYFLTNLAVCDPLSRRYVLLPLIPKEMTAQQDRIAHFSLRLAPIGEDKDETSFKVICTAYYGSKLVVFVFSSVTGQWCMAASTSWSSLGAAKPKWGHLDHFNYIRGCLYWTDLLRDKLVVLDMSIMEFSTVKVLTGYHVQLRYQSGQSVGMSTIIDGTKGALEMLTLAVDHSPKSFFLYHTTQQNNGESSSEWQLTNVMELPRGWLYDIMGATEGFLFLRGIQEDQWDDNGHGVLPGDKYDDYFALEVKTFELKKVCRATYYAFPNPVHSYFAFPPSLSEPSL